MNMSNSQRVTKLVSSLCRKPEHIWPYFLTNILVRKYPADWPFPWWSFDAIQEADNVFTGKRIFEYGSGGSTIRYMGIAESITSIEDDAQWYSIISEKVKMRDNVTVLHRPFDFRNPVGFDRSEYLRALNSDQYDVIIIDGQDWSFQERITCFRHAEHFVSPGAIIVVDDYWRYKILTKSHTAKKMRIFESTGPCRFGVTSTAFFYY
jgi:hypothetical protein